MQLRRPPSTATRPVEVAIPPSGVAAFVSRHGRRFRTADLLHPFHKLCLVEAGRGRLQHLGGTTRMETGHFLHIPANLAHRFEDAPASRLTLSGICLTTVAVAAPRSLHAAWHDAAERLPAMVPVSLPRPFAAAEYQRMIRQMIRESAEARPHAGLACVALVCQMLVTLCRELRDDARRDASVPPDGFHASLAWLEDRLTRRVTIPDLARIAEMSYRAYTGRFHRELGLTVTQYLNRRRVAIARQRLLETGDIVSTALEAGFGDLSHFYRQFKAHTGCTPAAYLAREARPARR